MINEIRRRKMKNMNLNSAKPIIESLSQAYTDKKVTGIIFNLKHILLTATNKLCEDLPMLVSLMEHLDKSHVFEGSRKHPTSEASDNIAEIERMINKDNALCKEDFLERCYNIFIYAHDLLSNVNQEFNTSFDIEDVVVIDEGGTEQTILELLDSTMEVEDSSLPLGIKSVFFFGAVAAAEGLKQTELGEKYRRLLDFIIAKADQNIESNNNLH